MTCGGTALIVAEQYYEVMNWELGVGQR